MPCSDCLALLNSESQSKKRRNHLKILHQNYTKSNQEGQRNSPKIIINRTNPQQTQVISGECLCGYKVCIDQKRNYNKLQYIILRLQSLGQVAGQFGYSCNFFLKYHIFAFKPLTGFIKNPINLNTLKPHM